jgi:hypothetical protein
MAPAGVEVLRRAPAPLSSLRGTTLPEISRHAFQKILFRSSQRSSRDWPSRRASIFLTMGWNKVHLTDI